MSNELIPSEAPKPSVFEQTKKTNVFGSECWSSRDFAKILEYEDYRNFEEVIDKARLSCTNSGHNPLDHFGELTEMVSIGSGAQRPIKTVMLSRYACYLVIQNADPSKAIVAHGQSYFAIQTRKQELSEEALEDERRLILRGELREHNKHLVAAAKEAGVVTSFDYAMFQNHGYMGLYGGLTAADIQRRKGLAPSQPILDHMGSAELAANLFRATQAEQKLKRDKIVGDKNRANKTHHEVGVAVRKTIEGLGGTMPEKLPTAENIKKLEMKSKKKKLPPPKDSN